MGIAGVGYFSDQAGAGFQQMITGEHTETYYRKGLRTIGFSYNAVNAIDFGTGTFLALGTSGSTPAPVYDMPNMAKTSTNSALVPYWPGNGGALGRWENVMAEEGQILDRYGSAYGFYASPVGTPFNMRALSPATKIEDYFQFQVLKPFPMKMSTIAPAFEQIGLGVQYLTPVGINYLRDFGYIKILN